MWEESDSEDDDYKYENDEDDDDDEEREVHKNRRRASVAVTQTHAHSKKSDLEKGGDEMAVTEDTTWLYRDPQGDTQGPFTNTEMSGWYEAGYFGPDLLVKREQDSTFVLLRVLTKKNGANGPSTNPFVVTSGKPKAPAHEELDNESEESSEESEEEQLRQPVKQPVSTSPVPKQTPQPQTQAAPTQPQAQPQAQSKPLESALRKSSDTLAGMRLIFRVFLLF